MTESCRVRGPLVLLLVLWILAGGAWGQWVIIHDGNGVVASGVPDALCDALRGVSQQKEPIKCVFLHQDGSWGIVSGYNRWQASLTPQFAELGSDLQSLQSSGHELRQVSVQPDGPGYAIVYGDKGVAARRVPQSLVNYLQPGIPGRRIGCLALGPADHWFISFDQGGYQSVAALSVLDAIKPLAAAYRRMDWVWYTNHQFGMVYESNGWTGLRIPGDLAQELNQLNARHSVIQVVVAPERGVGSASLRLQPNLAIASTPVLEVAKDVPAPANAFRRLVSQPYALTAQPPLDITVPFEKASLPAGASVYPVLGRGTATVRLPGGRVNLEKGELSFRIERHDQVHLEGGADFRSSFFAAAVDAPGLQEVLPGKPDCSIWAEPGTLAKAQAAAPSFYRTLSEIRARYAALGYRLPAHLDVYLVPLKGVRGVAGPQSLEFNLDVWADDDSSRATLAHELFHVVQGMHGRGADLNQITEVEGNWADEATAMLMGYRLYPKADTLSLWAQALDPEFLYRELMTFVPNSNGENPGYPAHQYLSFIFFRFLETLYDIDAVLQALYPTVSPQTRPGSVHEVLENFVAGTPDRKGRTRSMSEVYVNFALSYAWHKDVSPLERATRLRKKHSLQLPPARGAYHVGWNLPYDDGGQRRMKKSFRGKVGNYAISRAYNLSSMTREKQKEKGDLTIRVEGPTRIRLVVFPYRSTMVEPMFGSTANPVTLKDWHKWGGALIWVVHPAESLRENYTLTVAMETEKAAPVAGPGRWVCAGPRLLEGPAGFDPSQTSYTYTDTQNRSIMMSWSAPPLTLAANQEFALRQVPSASGDLVGQCYWAWNYAFEAVVPQGYHWTNSNRGMPGRTPAEIRLRLKADEAAVKAGYTEGLERVIYVNVFVGAKPLQIEWRYEYQR